ncbi:MAG: DUF975 family protein, partial [Firmicutes bacterium]|nr:DUF975 family protein [Bacillota bacterium]
MLKAKDFRAQARAALKGKWVQAAIAGLIASILGGSIFYQGYAGSSASSTTDTEAVSTYGFEVIIGVIVIFAIVGAVFILIGSIVGLGYAKFNLSLFENETADFKMIFSERSRYKDCFKLFVMQYLYIAIGSLLLVVPGIIAYYANIMAPYIMVDNPQMTAREAIKASQAMMKGNKWRLFCLSWSFIGWDILALFTLGLGHIVLCPYVEAA